MRASAAIATRAAGPSGWWRAHAAAADTMAAAHTSAPTATLSLVKSMACRTSSARAAAVPEAFVWFKLRASRTVASAQLSGAAVEAEAGARCSGRWPRARIRPDQA